MAVTVGQRHVGREPPVTTKEETVSWLKCGEVSCSPTQVGNLASLFSLYAVFINVYGAVWGLLVQEQLVVTTETVSLPRWQM